MHSSFAKLLKLRPSAGFCQTACLQSEQEIELALEGQRIAIKECRQESIPHSG